MGANTAVLTRTFADGLYADATHSNAETRLGRGKDANGALAAHRRQLVAALQHGQQMAMTPTITTPATAMRQPHRPPHPPALTANYSEPALTFPPLGYSRSQAATPVPMEMPPQTRVAFAATTPAAFTPYSAHRAGYASVRPASTPPVYATARSATPFHARTAAYTPASTAGSVALSASSTSLGGSAWRPRSTLAAREEEQAHASKVAASLARMHILVDNHLRPVTRAEAAARLVGAARGFLQRRKFQQGVHALRAFRRSRHAETRAALLATARTSALALGRKNRRAEQDALRRKATCWSSWKQVWREAVASEQERMGDADRLRHLHNRAMLSSHMKKWLKVATGRHSTKRAQRRYEKRRSVARERLEHVARENGWPADVVNDEAVAREMERLAIEQLTRKQNLRTLRDFIASWREVTRLRRAIQGKLFTSGRMHTAALLRQCLSAMMELVAQAQLAWASEGIPWHRRKLWATAARIGRDAKQLRMWRNWHGATRLRKQLKRALKVMMSRSVSANFDAWRRETFRLRKLRGDAAQQWLLVSRAALSFPFSRWRAAVASERTSRLANMQSAQRMRQKLARASFRRVFKAWRGMCSVSVEDALKDRLLKLEMALEDERASYDVAVEQMQAEIVGLRSSLDSEVQKRQKLEQQQGGMSRRQSSARASFKRRNSKTSSGMTTPESAPSPARNSITSQRSKADLTEADATRALIDTVRSLVTPASAYARARASSTTAAAPASAGEAASLREELDAVYRVIHEVASLID